MDYDPYYKNYQDERDDPVPDDFGPPAPSPDSQYPIVSSDTFHPIPRNTRHFFYWLIIIISVLAIIGNVLAVRSIMKRNIKYLQKSCILALALSDMFTIIIFSANILDTLSKEKNEWTLGEFLCYFIPFGQIYATTTSSLLLAIIAMDRYQNVIQSFSSKRWNPKPLTCILTIFSLFIICGVVSYPMYTEFSYETVRISTSHIDDGPTFERGILCMATRSKLKNYYVVLDIVIFVPMLTVFIWFYINIAALVWKHRKPITSKFNTCNTVETENSSSISNASGMKVKKEKNLHAKRKIRTFRIVLVLIVSFVACRFPYWCYYTIRLLGLKAETDWNVHLALLSLNMFNCVLNPLLYTFISQTLTAIRMIKDFLWKICCCCFSNDEFDEFQKENPFARDQVKPACGAVKPKIIFEKFNLEDKNEKPQQKF